MKKHERINCEEHGNNLVPCYICRHVANGEAKELCLQKNPENHWVVFCIDCAMKAVEEVVSDFKYDSGFIKDVLPVCPFHLVEAIGHLIFGRKYQFEIKVDQKEPYTGIEKPGSKGFITKEEIEQITKGMVKTKH